MSPLKGNGSENLTVQDASLRSCSLNGSCLGCEMTYKCLTGDDFKASCLLPVSRCHLLLAKTQICAVH